MGFLSFYKSFRNTIRRVQAEYWIALFGVFLIAAAWFNVVQRSHYELTDQITDIYDLNGGLARALEEHVRRILKTADNTLLYMKTEYEEQNRINKSLSDFVQRTKSDHSFNQIAIANASGDLVLSAAPMKRPINIAYRQHFMEQKANPDAGLIIAKPVITQVSGTWSIFLSRRLNKKDGSFAGVVSIGLDPRYFSDFYSTSELGRDRSIVVVGLDHIVRARYFRNDSEVGQDISASPLFTAIRKSPAGNFEAVSVIDLLPRFVSYRAMQDYPLVAMVSSLKSTALSAFAKRKKEYYTSAMVFTIVTALSCLLLIRAERRARTRKSLLVEELWERKWAEELLRESERNLLVKDRINNIFLTHEGDEAYGELLNCILEVLKSKYGVFGYFDGNGRFIAPALTMGIFWNECNMDSKDEIFSKGFFCSLWKKAFEARTTLIINEGPFNTPPGHIPIRNTMMAPVIFRDEFISVIHIANKETGYKEEDRALLDSISKHMAPVLYARIQRDKQDKERRKVEEFLGYSEKRYRELFGAITDALMVHEFNPDGLPGRFFEVNDVACRMLGYTREELLAMTPVDIDAPGSGVDIVAVAKRLAAGETLTFEQVHVAKGGRHFPVEVTVHLFNYQRRPAVLAMVHDITARKWAENALRESEEQYYALFENSPDGILLIGLDGKFIEFNVVAHEQLGYSREEFAALSLPDIDPFQSPDEMSSSIDNAFKDGSAQFEARHKTKDGKIRDVLVICKVMMLRNQPVFHTIWRDITDLKLREREITSYQKQLQDLMYKSTLLEEMERKRIADELHDTMGQNLAFSKLRLSSLRESISDDSNKAATDEIIDLLDQTIQFSRSLTYELGSPVLYTVGLEAGIRWLAEQVEKHHGITVAINMAGNLTIIKDEMKMLLYKTVRELLFNVLKHAQASRVDIIVSQKATVILIEVTDNGSGFKQEAQTGYGLFSVTERIKYLGGTMKITSDAEAGTCVSISVPLSPGKEGGF